MTFSDVLSWFGITVEQFGHVVGVIVVAGFLWWMVTMLLDGDGK